MAARRSFALASGAIVLLAACLRFWALDGGLPHPMSRPDEEVILAHTGTIAQGQADPSYAVYPPAYLRLTWAWGAAGLAIAQALGVSPPGAYVAVLRDAPARLLLVDRALSALAGTLTVLLLILVTRHELGAAAGLAAGAVLATSFLHVRDSHAVKPDALLTLGVVAALGLMAALARGPSAGRAAALGGVIGLATGIKYPALLLLAPAWVAAVLGAGARGWRRLVPRTALVVGGATAAAFAATSPQLFLTPQGRTAVLSVLGSIFPDVFPQLVSRALPKSLAAMRPEHVWWEGFAYHATFSLRYGAGLALTLAAPAAVVWGLVSRRPLAVLAAVYAVVYYAVNGLSPMILARYMTPLVPALAILVGGGLVAASARVPGARRRATVLALATGALVAEPLAASIGHDLIASRTDTRVLATRWLAAHVPPGSRVAVVGTRFWAYGEPVMPPGVSAVRLRDGAEAQAPEGIEYVLTHDHAVFSSRVDPAALAALGPPLHLLAEFDPFTPGRTGAVFEYFDAYYVPMHGFSAVTRPGPHIRIYRLDRSAAARGAV